ncbi:hypothetical protein LTR17_016995 [Elasticomyces elasticus]|nr:hypothetical protein LTR17_016995 [Elasticomyces elasticus]
MKILDAGTETISNLDVLAWIASKRAQHTTENAEDKAAGKEASPHPKNFLDSLTKHERELKNAKLYPYSSNPTAYTGGKHYEVMARFDKLLMERVCFPLEDKYKNGDMGMTTEEVEKALSKEQDEKALTETEQLMLLNHAPSCIEQLQPMVEGCEERFTPEEQQVVVDCIMEVYRVEDLERRNKAELAAEQDAAMEEG